MCVRRATAFPLTLVRKCLVTLFREYSSDKVVVLVSDRGRARKCREIKEGDNKKKKPRQEEKTDTLCAMFNEARLGTSVFRSL